MQRDREVRENSNPRDSPFDSMFSFRDSMFPTIFGGKDPFDDPFFSLPHGSLFGLDTFRSNSNSKMQQTSKLKGPVIKEIDSDAEEEEDDARGASWSNRNPLVEHPEDQTNGKYEASCFCRFHNEVCLLIIIPNMADHDKNTSNGREVSYTTNHNKAEVSRPQTRSVSFQRVTYGGINGAYYSSTTSRRSGSDGVCLN